MTDQPIPVTEAIAALEREIAAVANYDQLYITQARNGYRAALEYLLMVCNEIESNNRRDIVEGQEGRPFEFGSAEYAAVAPIVARWRTEDKR